MGLIISRSLPHVTNCVILCLIWGSSVEHKIGLVKTAILFPLGGIVGNLFSLYLATEDEDFILGAEPGLFAFLGASLGYIIFNWYSSKQNVYDKLFAFIIVGFIFVFLIIF